MRGASRRWAQRVAAVQRHTPLIGRFRPSVEVEAKHHSHAASFDGGFFANARRISSRLQRLRRCPGSSVGEVESIEEQMGQIPSAARDECASGAESDQISRMISVAARQFALSRVPTALISTPSGTSLG